MKSFKYFGIYILLIALILGANIGFAQTSRNLALTGGPDGDYSGFPMKGTFDLTFTNVPGVNPSDSRPLPANSLQIIVQVPPGIEVADNYTPPSGWMYTKTAATTATLSQVGPVSSSAPFSIVAFAIPLNITSAVDEGVWTAQIQRLLPTYQDLDPNNSSPEGTVSVADNALPVKLLSFDAKKEGSTANLSWKTTEETNSERFVIERSNNAITWIVIGERDAAGDSKKNEAYGFVDVSPLGGRNYYRLKMIDKDATFAYSSIKTLDFPITRISVYPNPVTDELTIDSNPGNLSKVRLYDGNGRTVFDSGPRVSNKINVRNLVSGIYMVRLDNLDGTFHTQKVLVVR